MEENIEPIDLLLESLYNIQLNTDRIFVAEDSEYPDKKGYFNLIKTKDIKGILIDCDGYPLNGLDLTLEQHLDYFGYIGSIKPFGRLVRVGDKEAYFDEETIQKHLNGEGQ